MAMPDMELLREEWKTLYSVTLPELAKARDPCQPKWPITLDHCFARIILDNAIGDGQKQWDKVLPKPAVRNMNEQQLQKAIALGLKIVAGDVDLCRLDEISLECRGKNEKNCGLLTAKQAPRKERQEPSVTGAPKRTFDEVEESDATAPRKGHITEKKQSTLDFWRSQAFEQIRPTTTENMPRTNEQQPYDDDLKQILRRVRSHPSLTPYRKRLYTVLLSVPRGRYTTYAAMSEYLKSSARAVGNGMRNNPFAPEVPCHRVLAADGSIGGFQGDWGKDGKHAAKKMDLLRGEGVRFDSRGKVSGEPFRKFHDFQVPEDSSA
jgi:methylated-DNA-[protein]-cysteine S-methyltransferase